MNSPSGNGPAGTVWRDLHQNYETRSWIDKPSMFAESALAHFPKNGRVLDLGAGLGQDSKFFAEHGYIVVSTDIEQNALAQTHNKLPAALQAKVAIQQVDLREPLPFGAESFDVVYAHLSLHYFSREATERIIQEIWRVLKPGGVLAFLVNSVGDPEYGTGEKIEDDYFHVEGKAKRFFSVETAAKFTENFDVRLLDDQGETYKDIDKGVHNLIRYIGTKPAN